MYINQNSLQYKHFLDFEKYARFICETFDINVVLDATRAETDGKVIYLPNVMSMTSKELDMMYAILLHEAGHIRYSTFDESYFKALKSKAHAFLANAIEDGRIENLLMKDFGGAKDMFESLYCDYTQDKALMRKIFKHDGQKPDLFTTLSFHVHNKIINCNTASLKEIAGAYRAGRINKFWKDNNIDGLIAANPLKNDKDVIKLTNEIYDLFAKKFQDKSEKLDFAKEIKQKEVIEKKLAELKEEGLKVEKQVQEMTVELGKIQEKIEDFEKSHPELEEMENAVRENNGDIEKMQSKIDWKKEYDRTVKQLSEMGSTFESLDKEINQSKEELKALEEKLQSGVSGRGKKPMTEEQKDKWKSKVDAKKSQLEKLNKKLESQKNQEKMLQDFLKEADYLSKLDSDKYDKNLNIDSMKAQKEALENQNSEYQEKINEINIEKNQMISDFNKQVDKIQKIQSDFMEKSADMMFDIDKMTGNTQFDLDILPEMNYEDVWPEAAAAQENFDQQATKKTGKMVRNGEKAAGLFGTNVRDILTYIDKAKEKVEEIDVTEIFKNKINTSKLDDFNAEVKEKNYMDDKSVVGVFGTYREHIPLTTMYDTIKKENFSTNKQEMMEMMKKNAGFYRDLKRVFAKKFKFAKKDFWKGAQEEGQLDARNLWKLPTNQGDDYYEVNKQKFVNKTAATILIDISGSQNKDATEYGQKIKELVLGLSLALDEVHIKHEILGFHAPVCEEMRTMQADIIYTRRSNNLETIVYKEATQKDNSGILNIETQMSDNSDGESLRIAMKRLKKIQAKSHMIFMISDGKPFLCDTDVSVLDEDLRTALRQAVKDKIQMIGLGFFNQLEHFFGNRFCNAGKYEDVVSFFDKTYFQV